MTNTCSMIRQAINSLRLLPLLFLSLSSACGLADALLEKSYEPQVSLRQTPALYTQSGDAKFELECNKANCSFFCLNRQSEQSLEYTDADFQPCSSEFLIPGLKEGTHRLFAYAIDASDQRGPTLEFLWHVDQTKPQTQFPDTFNGYVNTATNALNFSCIDDSPCTFTCQLEQGPITECAPPLNLDYIEDGSRIELTIQATDAAGNTEDSTPNLTRTIVVDNRAPEIEFSSFPGKNSKGRDNSSAVSVSFKTKDSGNAGPEIFECQFNDDKVISDCSSPWEAILPSPSSSSTEFLHTLRVRAIDGADNIGAWARVSWIYDTLAPQVILVEKPSLVTAERDAVFHLACTKLDCTYLCSLDGASPSQCASQDDGSMYSISPISIGNHTLNVTAIDLAGNRSEPITYSWTVKGRWESLSTSGFHTCGVSSNQELYCWGYNEFGQTGHRSALRYGSSKYLETTLVPTQVGGGNNWKTVSTGFAHTCAIKTDGTQWCWGINKLGQDTYTRLGAGASEEFLVEPQLIPGQSWDKVGAGKDQTCATKLDNSLWCWGPNTSGPIQVPLDLLGNESVQEILDIQVANKTCVLAKITNATSSENRLYCSSGNPFQLDGENNLSTAGWRAFSIGSEHDCAITAQGRLYCRGDNGFGQSGGTFPSYGAWSPVGDQDDDWAQVAVNAVSSCGVQTDGSLWCWGAEDFGLDRSASTKISIPTRVGTQNDWASVLAGPDGNAMCAFTENQAVFCWGDNRHAQLGFDRGDKQTPYRITTPRASGWQSVDVGKNHSCALQNDSSLFCWGSNQSLESLVTNSRLLPQYGAGQLGATPAFSQSTNVASPLFETIPGRVATTGVRYEENDPNEDWSLAPNWFDLNIFSEGNNVGALQIDNDTYVWGSNRFGNLGIAERFVPSCSSRTRSEISGPTEISVTQTWNQISFGLSHTCATANGPGTMGGASLFCWGDNRFGQLGQGTLNQCRNEAELGTEVIPDGTLSNPAAWIMMSSGKNHNCALDINSKLQCWGDNSFGQVGVGSSGTQETPRLINNTDYLTVSAGSSHSCAIDNFGTLECWGSNAFGQAGQESLSQLDQPEIVQLPRPVRSATVGASWISIDAGSQHSCGIIESQIESSLWCWGSNRHGQLGTKDHSDENEPQRVEENQQWLSVSSGTSHSCGITTNGHLYCWGSNAFGKLGHGQGTIWYSSPAELR